MQILTLSTVSNGFSKGERERGIKTFILIYLLEVFLSRFLSPPPFLLPFSYPSIWRNIFWFYFLIYFILFFSRRQSRLKFFFFLTVNFAFTFFPTFFLKSYSPKTITCISDFFFFFIFSF